MTFTPLIVLVTSVSRKVPLLRDIRKAFIKMGVPGKIIGGDTNEHVIGRYFVDDFWKMPCLEVLLLDELVAYCRDRGVSVIIPTRDGELSYFARHREHLAAVGIEVMISPPASVDTCFDKFLFYERLKDKTELRIIPTVTDLSGLDAISYVVKERFGAGAKKILLDASRDEAHLHAEGLKSPVFQPFIEGREYSVDVYVMRQGKAKGAVVRSRDVVVNGESQVSTTIRNEKLEVAAIKLVETIGVRGHAICQAVVGLDGEHFIECNCRFGGASTLSVAAGLDSFYWFFLESRGVDISQYPFLRSKKELRQIRFPEDIVIDDYSF